MGCVECPIRSAVIVSGVLLTGGTRPMPGKPGPAFLLHDLRAAVPVIPVSTPQVAGMAFGFVSAIAGRACLYTDKLRVVPLRLLFLVATDATVHIGRVHRYAVVKWWVDVWDPPQHLVVVSSLCSWYPFLQRHSCQYRALFVDIVGACFEHARKMPSHALRFSLHHQDHWNRL